MTLYKLFLKILSMSIIVNMPLLAYTTQNASSLPIDEVVLVTEGQTVTQTSSGQGGPNDGLVNTNVSIKSITIENAGIKVLDNFATIGITVKNVNYRSGSDTSLIYARTNGDIVTIDNTTAYANKAQEALSGTDIRDYLVNDIPNYPYTRQLDFFYNNYTVNKSHYIMVQERNGNSTFSLLPLDKKGNAIPGAYRLEFSGGSAYPWNTGYSGGPDRSNSQKQYFGIVKMSDFNIGNHEVYGFSYFANDADCKFYVLGTDSFTDPKPDLSIDDVRKNEGDSGNTNFTFTLSLNQSSSSTVSVKYHTSDNTALISDNDYNSKTGTITFSPGTTTKEVTIKVKGDTKVEPDEIFYVDLDSVTGANIADSRGIGTIVNDDNDPSNIRISDIQKNEGNTGSTSFTFNVTLDKSSTKNISVNYATSNGTATTADSDYSANSGTVNFAAGETSKTVIILVNGDTKVEPDETFNVTLSNPSNVTISKAIGVGTILNDDSLPTLSIDDIQKDEGDSGTTDFDFTVSLSRSYPVDVTVDYLTTDGTATIADSDYQALTTNTLTIPAGQTTATITAKVNGDTIVESDETFNIILSNPSNASISDDTGVATILTDDSYPGITINDRQLNEGNSGTTNFIFTVSLDNAYASAVSVDYATSNGTATTADSDYSANSGTVNFAAGETSKTVIILVNGDTKVEPDETFNVTLSNPTNALIADATGVGTILNDDSLPTLSIDDIEQDEGDSGTTDFDFTVSLSRSYPVDVTVDYNTANGTATTADSDYNAASGSLTIAAGTTTASVNIAVNGDIKIEEDETFTVTLSNPQNATLGSAVGTGTILNDDFANLSVGDVSILEGDSGTKNLTFTLNLSEAFYNDVTLSYATQDGTATIADNDYVEVNATQVTFAPNETSKEINITINGDLNIEDDETFYLLLSNPSNVNISDTNLTGTILNDDNATLSIDDVNLSEGNTGYKDFNFTVSMSLPHREVVTVNYATYDGTAELADNDYNQTQGTLTFEPGETEKTVTVKVIGDFFIEPDETFTVTLSNVSANAYISTTEHTGTGTILNDDSGTQTSQMTFNVERTNSADTGNIGSDARNAWYTQISGRPFDYDVVSYDKDMANEYPLSNVVVKVSLRSINGTDNEQIGTEQYVYFSNEKTRVTYSGLKVDGAYKDAKFRIFVPTNGGGIILKTDCSGFGTDYKACYDKLEQDTKDRDSSGFSDIAVDTQDDFAIRPAGLKYDVSINTGEDLVDNTPPESQDKAFASGVNYNMHIRGVKYDDTATDITTYSTSTIIWGLAFDDASGTTCNDKEDYNGTLPVSNGSADTSTFTHSQVGIYTLSARDEEWTKVVDQAKGDCITGSSEVSSETDGTTKSGCNIGSEVTFNEHTYENDTITFNPYKFDVNITASTKPKNLEFVYMHDINNTDSTMSAQIDANVTALSKTGTKLSNFTKECMAQDVQYTMNISSDPEVLQDTLSGDHSIYVNVDDATYQIENNVSSELTLTKDKFAKDENGTAPITLNYNIDRLDNASMNPVAVTFNALNVSSPNAKYNTSISATTIPTGSSTKTDTKDFVYARVRASQKLYVGDRNVNNGVISTPLAMDIYCKDEVARPNLCADSNGTGVYGIRTSLTGDNWWLATASATSNEQGIVRLDNNNNDIKVPNATTDKTDSFDRDNAINLSVTVNCPDTNKITEVKLEDSTSPWIVFDNDPLYSVRCSGSGDWAGTGKLGSVVGGATDNGATLDEDGNRNNVRAPANQSTKTHRLSW